MEKMERGICRMFVRFCRRHFAEREYSVLAKKVRLLLTGKYLEADMLPMSPYQDYRSKRELYAVSEMLEAIRMSSWSVYHRDGSLNRQLRRVEDILTRKSILLEQPSISWQLLKPYIKQRRQWLCGKICDDGCDQHTV